MCETGKRDHDTEPGSFVVEIMRAIFTLPETHIHEHVTDRKAKHYDEAHAYGGDCSKLYPLCQDSIWNKNFIF